MKIGYILIIIISITLTLSACTSSNDNKIETDIYKGIQGVDVEIIKNAPPSEVLENQNFQVVAKITNKGVAQVIGGVLKITVEPDYISLTDDEDIITLEGKSDYNPFEDVEVKTYNLESKTIESLSEKHDTIILISMCYDYTTRLSTTVCVDPETYNIRPVDKVCEASTQSFSGGQGGPIAVSMIEQQAIVTNDRYRPKFFIYLTNVGGGKVTEYGKASAMCSSSTITKEDFDKVTLSDLEFSDYTLDDFDCEPKILKFDDTKTNRFVCTMKEDVSNIKSTDSGYLTGFSVTLDYGYMSTQTKIVTIQRLTNR